MSYSRINDRAAECVTIDWSEPRSLRKPLPHDYEAENSAYVYKIVGRFGNSYSLLYIGKTFNYLPSKRLRAADHIKRKYQLECKYPRHELMVSFGSISTHMTEEKLSDIENLLIFSHAAGSFPKLINVKNRGRHSVVANYCLTNTGFRRDGMYSEVALAVFCRN